MKKERKKERKKKRKKERKKERKKGRKEERKERLFNDDSQRIEHVLGPWGTNSLLRLNRDLERASLRHHRWAL